MATMQVKDDGRLGWFGYLDWGAILASVFAGLGLTLLLVALGSAAGIEAADDGGDETRISWGFVQVLALWLAGNGIAGLLAGGLRSVQDTPSAEAAQGTAEEVAEAVSWGGWALALGMILTLAAAIAGWWLGSRTRLADAETEDVGVRVR